jgi:cellulose synthase/poly-beta-1,6-N-acetylglucosamine synthase-like glycosyltransferase
VSSASGAAAPRSLTRERLGDVLVARGAITRQQLTETLERQRRAGSRLGRELSAHGDVSRLELFQALAQVWGLPFIDLIADPPDDALLQHVGSETMLREHWVPHHFEAGGDTETGPVGHVAGQRVVVATAEEPNEDLADRVCDTLGVEEVRFLATTDWDIDQAVLLGCQDEVVAEAAYGLAAQRPELSADTGWARWQHVAVVIALLALFVSAIFRPSSTLTISLVAINLMFFVGVVFKLAACTVGMIHLSRLRRSHDPRSGARPVVAVPRVPDNELPVFTILVPAYREANVVSKVIEHVRELDYPMSKLQVLLLMEADDDETITAAKAARPPDCVRFVVVPPFGPQTKPKACNVGLALAEGEFLVIYDAEDRPEPGQLREVVDRFAETGDHVACFQARLNYFNARQNILTRMFTLEYSMWFDTMLPGLDAWKLPIPLGGTSNHFRVDSLRSLGAWDPYNVTEDADLGIRASAQGMSVGITESTTWEEACSEWKAWIRQRTRWIKGYMVTALVHTRRPRTLWRETGWRGYAGLIGLIAGTPAMFLACPLVWGFWLYTFLGGSVAGFHLPGWVQTATTANLIIGNGAMIAIGALAACRRGAFDLMPYSLLNPAYWILHSIAAWRALWQLVFSPSKWEKTPHGIQHGPEAHAAKSAKAGAHA